MVSKAPIKETLAAALILLTPWKKDRILVDPFCGSGTFPIEAAMIAANMAPGMNRSFTAEKWTNFLPRKGWYEAVDEAFDLVDDQIETDIQGYDIDGEITTDFPTTVKLEKAKPVIEKLPGWKCDIRGIKNYEDLPENCKKYIEFVEEHIGFPITMISNGPGRDDIIYRNK